MGGGRGGLLAAISGGVKLRSTAGPNGSGGSRGGRGGGGGSGGLPRGPPGGGGPFPLPMSNGTEKQDVV